MDTTKNQLESLQQALTYDHVPLCSGAISPPPEGFHLYYGRQNSKFIDLASATPEEIDQLSAACDPATFGRGKEDVYDESYRKAVKMDASNFAVQFDPARAGLIKTIEEQLLWSQQDEMSISAEMYKLNVYGKDSFFKAHVDTPRGTDMLGSLVLVFPTPHQGGELALRHKGREWTFDANALMTLRPPPSLAYVAFYSDIEHEVLKVTSGHRITLTYNLYSAPTRLTVTPDPNPPDNFQATLRGLLKSPEFLPDGGTLGFGLAHLYPVTFSTVLRDLAQYLKGGDAHIYKACQELRLKPALQMIYDGDGDGDYRTTLKNGIMMGEIVEQPYYAHWTQEETYRSCLIDDLGGIPVNTVNPDSHLMLEWFNEDHRERITWISPFNVRNQLRDFTVAQSNDVSVDYIYCSPCLIARVPPASDRVS